MTVGGNALKLYICEEENVIMEELYSGSESGFCIVENYSLTT